MVLPGRYYLVSRRCTQRQFLLKPSKEVNRAFLFCLAVAAQATGVQVHVIMVMSNHYHLIVTDPFGLLPHVRTPRAISSRSSTPSGVAHRWPGCTITCGGVPGASLIV